MDVLGLEFIRLWECLSKYDVRYITVDELAVALHGFNNFTGVISIWIDDSAKNRERLRFALKEYGIGDFEGITSAQHPFDLIDFTLETGLKLNINIHMKGLEEYSFDECEELASVAEIENVSIPFLHINHLIANKKAVNRPKDQVDVIYLEKIKKLREEENL